MKFTAALPFVLLTSVAAAQNTLPPDFNHPPMAGHPAGAGQAAGQAAPTPYRFNPYGSQTLTRVPEATNEGTVISAQTAGGYTYAEVSGPSGNIWLAGPESKIATGDRVRYPNGAVMYNFSSKSIGRSFPRITFVGSLTKVDPNAPPLPAAAATPAAGGNPHGMPGAAAGAPGMQMGLPAAPVPSTEGVVLQTQDAGGYSYVEVKTEAGSTWLAAPMTKLNVGDKVRFEAGAEMRNFSSRALNRTFPSIQFVDRVAVVTAK